MGIWAGILPRWPDWPTGGASQYVGAGRARNNIVLLTRPPSRASWIRVLVMKRNYTGIPLRMDAGQPGHANHAI
eukprot:COSAG01_NODE_6393_length_3695_cov_7.934112_3_plen_74_part_00